LKVASWQTPSSERGDFLDLELKWPGLGFRPISECGDFLDLELKWPGSELRVVKPHVCQLGIHQTEAHNHGTFEEGGVWDDAAPEGGIELLEPEGLGFRV
jgi:hypothetical protein